ncbi:hypothetical protein Calla_0135 [Caldicellulosiruptor acetigenus 6A]|uniref:Uncharacterized protein n=1 Tax=Caldicellulosiruptor acetigenus 6A TaxID=632516 RepID=G2PVS7_9FIRM|nr:hypothetical protein Calla_0135 [Caldicellulosiruptor acetigenus 6A]
MLLRKSIKYCRKVCESKELREIMTISSIALILLSLISFITSFKGSDAITSRIFLFELFGVNFITNYLRLLVLICIIGICYRMCKYKKQEPICFSLLLLIIVTFFEMFLDKSFFKFTIGFSILGILSIPFFILIKRVFMRVTVRFITFVLWSYPFYFIYKLIPDYSSLNKFIENLKLSIKPFITEEGKLFMLAILYYSSYFITFNLLFKLVSSNIFKKLFNNKFKKYEKLIIIFSNFLAPLSVAQDFKLIYISMFVFLNCFDFFI